MSMISGYANALEKTCIYNSEKPVKVVKKGSRDFVMIPTGQVVVSRGCFSRRAVQIVPDSQFLNAIKMKSIFDDAERGKLHILNLESCTFTPELIKGHLIAMMLVYYDAYVRKDFAF